MTHRTKHVRGNHVSCWIDEDGCGVEFSRDGDTDDEYLLIQRHFEEPDDGRPCIVTDDARFCGFFRNVLATLDRDGFEISFGSRSVAVSFAVTDDTFETMAKAIRILIPKVQVAESRRRVAPTGG